MEEDPLLIDVNRYEDKTYRADGREVTCRAYLGLPYCTKPADPIQVVNIFIPMRYVEGDAANSCADKTGCAGTGDTPDGATDEYDASSAPIFIPNTVGGYLPGPADEPGLNARSGHPNALFEALAHGYVCVSGGVRGRTTGKATTEFFEGSRAGELGEATGRKLGRAPAFIVDEKAIIRFIRHNAGRIPGDVERMVTDGISAGGALSALAGATGNDPAYEPYLEEIGAADERDDIFAASCYCPIHNLENADAAYEWQFCGQRAWRRLAPRREGDQVVRVPVEGLMSDRQMELSEQLKSVFPAYVNSLGLVDEDGAPLTLAADGTGSFRDRVAAEVARSAQRELDLRELEGPLAGLGVEGSDLDAAVAARAIRVEDGQVAAVDWERYNRHITRMKDTPAFDHVDLGGPENEEFGDECVDGRHFMAHPQIIDAPADTMADPAIVRLMNPVPHIAPQMATRHWRIRHGSFDRDTSLAIPTILALKLRMAGCDVDYRLPWGLPHCGDYQLGELFAWIDGLCQ